MLGYYTGGALGSIAGIKAFSLYQWPGVVIISIFFILLSTTFNSFAKK